MALYPPNMLSSASCDGNIFVWSLETGRLLYCLNGYISMYPQTLTAWLGSGFNEYSKRLVKNKTSEEEMRSAANSTRRRGVVCQMPGQLMHGEENRDHRDSSSAQSSKYGMNSSVLTSVQEEGNSTTPDGRTPQYGDTDDDQYAPPKQIQFAVEKLVFLQVC